MYKIPREERVARAILNVLNKRKEVPSQRLFHDLVMGEMNKGKRTYAISVDRLKKIAAKMEGVGIFIENKRTNRVAKKCYICGNELEERMARDLFGDKISQGRKCSACGFELEKDNLAPKRYVFYAH